jgi:hypothetical protein
MGNPACLYPSTAFGRRNGTRSITDVEAVLRYLKRNVRVTSMTVRGKAKRKQVRDNHLIKKGRWKRFASSGL